MYNGNSNKKYFASKNSNAAKKNMLNIQLLNKNQVLLTGPFSIFSEQFKQIIKACEGRYITEEKGWIMPRNYLNTILTTIQNEKLEIPVNKIPAFVDKILQPFNGIISYKSKTGYVKIEYNINDRLKDLRELPGYLNQKLYAFQKQGVMFGLRNFGRVLIADEMGVGKTIQALALASMYKSDWPMLIITPSSLRFNWRDEIFRWLDEIRTSEIQVVVKSATEIKANIKALIISYDLASKMSDALEDYKFQTAIVDEAHYLKNAEAKRTENLVPIIKKCKRCIILTGTPAFARPKELYNLMHILRPDVFTNFREFGNRYCDPAHNRFSGGLDYNGAVNTKELHYILLNSIMIRRLKKDVLTELPPKRRQKIEVKLDNQYVKKIQDAISKSKGTGQMSSLVDNLMDTFFEPDSETFQAQVEKFEEDKRTEHPEVLQCYLYTGLAKIPGIQEYLNDLAQNDIKFLIFAHHTEVLNAIEEQVCKMKLKYIRIDGKVDQNKRYERVKSFQEDESVKIGILSLTAAGVGYTLTAASTVIFAEMYWTPAIMLQAEDRIHRMGQKNKICVNYHYLYGDGTLDSLLYEKLQTKLAIVSEILEGKSEYLNVEETKDTIGEYNTPLQDSNSTDKKKKKDAYGNKRNTSPLPGEKVSGMHQLTSYFQKKPEQSGEKVSNAAHPQQTIPLTEKKPKNDFIQQDSINWEEIEKILDEDMEDKAKTESIQEQTIQPFNDATEEYKIKEMEMQYKKEQRDYEEAKDRGRKEQHDFENKIFYNCLNDILEKEKATNNRFNNSNSNSRDIRSFIGKSKELVEEEKDGLLSLWKSPPREKKESIPKNIPIQPKDDMFLMKSNSNYKTPIRTAESSGSKKNSGSQNKGGFRFSLQPTTPKDIFDRFKEATNSRDNSEKNERKRKHEVVELELDEGEPGITSHVIKRLKENMPVINERYEE